MTHLWVSAAVYLDCLHPAGLLFLINLMSPATHVQLSSFTELLSLPPGSNESRPQAGRSPPPTPLHRLGSLMRGTPTRPTLLPPKRFQSQLPHSLRGKTPHACSVCSSLSLLASFTFSTSLDLLSNCSWGSDLYHWGRKNLVCQQTLEICVKSAAETGFWYFFGCSTDLVARLYGCSFWI